MKTHRMAINEWWVGDSGQRFWMETTNRSDLGANLMAPLEDERGSLNSPGYVLVKHVQDGDIVLHWDTHQKALVAWSRASGGYWQDEIYWGAVPAGVEPYNRPAWVHGLDGPFWFEKAIGLAEVQSVGEGVGELRGDLQEATKGAIYFPFIPYAEDWSRLRPNNPYMTKFPAELVDLIPGLSEELAEAGPLPVVPPVPGSSQVGQEYEEANEEPATSEREPFDVDPAVVDRGVAGHAVTQNALAAWVRSKKLDPLRPGPGDPAFDLAWWDAEVLYVAEVKSLTTKNEEKQLRLGLGQVLRYRHLLGKKAAVVAVLAVEREPSDPSWRELCTDLTVRLVWPGSFQALADT